MASAVGVPGWVTLGAGESAVWSSRPSPYLVKKWIAIGIVVLLAGVLAYAIFPASIQWIPLLVVVASVPIGAWAYLLYRNVNYVVTTQKVYRKTGVFRRDVQTLRLANIQNVSFSQTWGQRLFSCGDVRIATSGTGTPPLVFRSVTNPESVNSLLVDRIEG